MATIWIHNRKSSTMSEESIKKLPKLFIRGECRTRQLATAKTQTISV
jgi:hypothetical protein